MPQKLHRLTVVLAQWCPHCVPLSVDMAKKMADELGVSYRVLDIDEPDQLKLADEIVMKHGDDCEDYLIPQVFAEFSDGSVQHVLTGSSETTSLTKQRWENFFDSRYYSEQLRSAAFSSK